MRTISCTNISEANEAIYRETCYQKLTANRRIWTQENIDEKIEECANQLNKITVSQVAMKHQIKRRSLSDAWNQIQTK